MKSNWNIMITVHSELGFTSFWTKRVTTKKEAVGLKSTPSSTTEIFSFPHGKDKCLLGCLVI